MIGCIIQARTGSKRLPKKIFYKIDKNLTVLEFLINQINSCKKINKTIIATTKLKKDDVIEKFCKKAKIEIFRGDENDVLDRYYSCAIENNFDIIIRITSDCPLIDPKIIDKMIIIFKKTKIDYFSNTLEKSFPKGMDVEIFTIDALKKSWLEAKLNSDREHVTKFIRRRRKFKKMSFKNSQDDSKVRITVDYIQDVYMLRELIKKIKERPVLLKHIIQKIDEFPKIKKINSKNQLKPKDVII